MNVLIVSGIWPPDVGGPASHAPELAAFLRARGHRVEALVTADAAPAAEAYDVSWVSRKLPAGLRHAEVVRQVTARSRSADVVYATSMLGRAALGAAIGRRPLVVKLVADEAYERAKRRGLFDGDIDAFQRFDGGPAVKLLRLARDQALQRVHHLVCPSRYLAELAVAWGVPPERVTVLPNPAPPVPPGLAAARELRERLGITGPSLSFAGRLTRQKALEVAFDAVGRCEDVTLLVAGDGPDETRLRQLAVDLGLADRIRFLGPTDRRGVLELFRGTDAAILSSAWENFPHSVVEALAVGTPIIATAAGGVAEVVRDGENGLLVPVGDAGALASAIRRFFSQPELSSRLREAAAPSVEHLASARIYERLESILTEARR